MKLNKLLLFASFTLLCFALSAQTAAVPGIVKKADKLFSKYKYSKALRVYQAALATKKVDSLYIMTKMGDAARLSNNAAMARLWYSRAAKMPKADAKVKLQYAQTLRQAGEYAEAKKWYEDYRKSYPADGNVEDIIKGLDKAKEMQKDNGNGYKIEPMQFNSSKSDISAFYIGRDTMLFLSNRTGKQKPLSDNSAGNSYYRAYRAAGNGLTVSTTRYKTKAFKKPIVGPMAYNAARKEIIFARSNKTCGTPKSMKSKTGTFTQLYTVAYPSAKAKPVLLPFNSNSFNNSQPSLSADGNTLYFVSDRPGGYGGNDIYMCKRAGQSWGAPVNLGSEINSKYDEKFPFVAEDGTLYFSSNGYAGLGGLDVYSSTNQNGKWAKPSNLGGPINTSADDFGYVADAKTKSGFLVSNSPGSFGGDDIYKFTYKDQKKAYAITVRVVDAETNEAIPGANISVPCTVDPTSSMLADMNGEGRFNIANGMSCDATSAMVGYTSAKALTKPDDKGVVILTMKKQPMLLQVVVKDKDGNQVVRDVNIKVTAQNDNTSKVYRTDGGGNFSANLNNSVTYIISSPDFKEIQDTISAGARTDDNGGIFRSYTVTYDNRKINVPLSADCFAGNSIIVLTNTATNETTNSKADADGKVTLALTPNTAYTISVDGKMETFSTGNLHPGDVITLSCKFTVGETWVLRNIYYDLAKFNIRPDAAKELDRLITVMKNNPSLEIELGSHTDCRQTAAYNNMLSARRAKSAVDYIGLKISKKRLLSAGYGESKLVNNCACEPTNDSPCTDEQHQANRRTEVKVLKY
jgi:outer membrane protein OmpA-like peptidoglycan-associated protein